jgi:hypothetical protein
VQFCQHPKLRYTWPTFLPLKEDTSDPFWSGHRERTKPRLNGTPCFVSRHSEVLKRIDSALGLTIDAADRNGNYLIDEPAKDLFISRHYLGVSMKPVDEYGVPKLYTNEVRGAAG